MRLHRVCIPLPTAHCPLPTVFCILSPSSECSREAEMYLAALGSEDCGIARLLWNQKIRRVEQPTVINRERSAQGRLNSQAQSDGVRPAHPHIVRVDACRQRSV